MGRTLIRKVEVVRRTSLSASTIWRLVDKGTFPKPVLLTEGGSVAWFQDEVDAWIESRQILTPELQRVVAPGTSKLGRTRGSSKTSKSTITTAKKEARHGSN